MTYAAKILADSVSPDGVRLTTFEVTMPRIVLAEFNTHRMFSRNSASSRAIPVQKMIGRVRENPYVPSTWGKNQKGMQAGKEHEDPELIEEVWLRARDSAVRHANDLLTLGIHKQLTNRLLEPFMWHTVIVTATEWDNFWHLRDNEHAHPDIQIPAEMMRELYESGEPEQIGYGEWHAPLLFPEDKEQMADLIMQEEKTLDRQLPIDTVVERMLKVSVARCARVSYLTHDGKRDLEADLVLYDRLAGSGHMSPLEHAARPMTDEDIDAGRCQWIIRPERDGPFPVARMSESFCGNFRGWVQYRKLIPGESDMLGGGT